MYGVWTVGEEAWAVGASGVVLAWDGNAWSLSNDDVGHTLYAVTGASDGSRWTVGSLTSVLRKLP